MTPKQKAALEHIHMYGNDDLRHIASRVLDACYGLGWVTVEDGPWPLGELPVNRWPLVLTDEGRQALHEASQ